MTSLKNVIYPQIMDAINEIDAIETELAEVTLAISAIIKGGQSHTINTGGGSRSVTMADYGKLVERKKELQYLLQLKNGSGGIRITPAW